MLGLKDKSREGWMPSDKDRSAEDSNISADSEVEECSECDELDTAKELAAEGTNEEEELEERPD